MNKPRHRFTLPLLVVLIAAIACLLLPAADALACPNCKAAVPESLPTDGGAAVTTDMARGYFWSILFMIGVPFTLVASMGTALYFTLRRSSAMVQLSAVESTERVDTQAQ